MEHVVVIYLYINGVENSEGYIYTSYMIFITWFLKSNSLQSKSATEISWRLVHWNFEK